MLSAAILQRQLMNLYLQFTLFTLAGWVNRYQQAVIEYLQAENQALREQLGKKRIRWTDTQRRRLAEKAKAVGRSALHQLGTVVTPDTLLRWYRNLVAAKYDGAKQRGPGRPRTEQDITELVVKMARESPTWGYTRLRGALYNLGHEVARNTIKNILLAHGLEPAPERGRHTSWSTFIKSHLGAIAGADFFTVEVLRGFGLVRYYVFFVIDIATRRVHIAGITSQPCEAWMTQIARNLTDCVDGFLKQTRYLILDRDPLYTRVFRGMHQGCWCESCASASTKPRSEFLRGKMGKVSEVGVSFTCDPTWRTTFATSSIGVSNPFSPGKESPRTG